MLIALLKDAVTYYQPAIIAGVIANVISDTVFYLIIKIISKKPKIANKRIFKVIEKHKIAAILIVGIIIGLIVGLTTSEAIKSDFKIINPKNGNAVPHKIKVLGGGGIPGSEIQVFVITSIDRFPQGVTKAGTNGRWTVFPVYIGESHQRGLEVEIYAVMTTSEGNVYESNYIKVKRE